MELSRILLVLTTSASLSAVASAGDVLEVGPIRPFSDIASAVAVASSGDVILVDEGLYSGDLDLTFGVTIVGRDGTPVIDGHIDIGPLAGNQAVVLSDLRIQATEVRFTFGAFEPIVEVDRCRGSVRLQDTVLLGSLPTVSASRTPFSCTNSNDVVATGCTFFGGNASGGFAVNPGGDGLVVGAFATVELDDCRVFGGEGSFGFNGGDGGHGVRVRADGVLLGYDSAFRGGDGGSGVDFFAGGGGNGLLLLANGSARLQGGGARGGLGGTADFGQPGSDGGAFGGPGEFSEVAEPTRTLRAPTVVRASDPGWSLTAGQHEPGETSELLLGFVSAPRFFDSIVRDLRVDLGTPDVLRLDPQSPDAMGEATRSFGPTVPPIGQDAVLVWSQSIVVAPDGSLRLTASRATIVLAAGF
ncbi:MAG: hypothetical protein AAGA20_05155 [Planctomycetota bacterium]